MVAVAAEVVAVDEAAVVVEVDRSNQDTDFLLTDL